MTRAPNLRLVVGGKLRCLRGRAGMTLDQVAAAMGSHRPVVARLEGGQAAAETGHDVDSILRYCAAVGADPREVFAEVDRALGLDHHEPVTVATATYRYVVAGSPERRGVG